MISVLDHIEYLVSEHECVIVPGFGAFISNYTITKSKDGLICGLKRSITFNRTINNNDGLLANSIVKRDGVTFERANYEIRKYVDLLYSQMKYEGEVPIGRIGFVKYHNDDLIEFFPFISSIVNSEFFGLSQLHIKPLQEQKINNDRNEKSSGVKVIPFTKKIIQLAASIILLIGLSLVLSTPIVNENNQNYANFNAFTIKSTDVGGIENNDLYISIPKYKQQVEGTQGTDDAEEIKSINKSSFKDGNYCLVVASLISENQVYKYVREQNLTDYEIIKSTNKYRVYIARGTYNDMCNLKTTKYQNSDAWVCRIK